METEVKTEKIEGLRKCPFCGSVKVTIEIKKHEIRKIGFPYTSKIQCNCGASITSWEFYDTEDEARTKAINMWQQRVK